MSTNFWIAFSVFKSVSVTIFKSGYLDWNEVSGLRILTGFWSKYLAWNDDSGVEEADVADFCS